MSDPLIDPTRGIQMNNKIIKNTTEDECRSEVATSPNVATKDESNLGSVIVTELASLAGNKFATPEVPRDGRSDGEESDCSIMSYVSIESSASGIIRGRKRAGAINAGVPGPKRRVVRQQETENLSKDVLSSPSDAITARGKGNLPSMEVLGESLKQSSTNELEDSIKSQLEEVEKVADMSRNLKGSFAHSLRLAARTVQAATKELALRTSMESNVKRLEQENAELRSKLVNLSTSVDKLTSELASLKGQSSSRPKVDQPTEQWKSVFLGQISRLIDNKLAALGANTQTPSQVSVSSRQTDPITEAVEPSGPTSTSKRKRGKKAAAPAPTMAPEPVAPVMQTTNMQPSVAQNWATVTARKPAAKDATTRVGTSKSVKKPKAQTKVKPLKVPKSAAITLTVPQGSEINIAAVMAAAKQRIRLSDCGIDTVRPKRAITGALILEVSGDDCSSKADVLAEKMRVALTDMDVVIGRPVKTGEIRVTGLDDAVQPTEVAAAVAATGDCNINDVKVGTIRRSRSGLGSAWVRCPLIAVRKLVAGKHVQIGWVSAKVEVLETRALQCFKCLEPGHVRAKCLSSEDRSNRCYACGELDHKASGCTAQLRKCPLCADLGRPSNHRLGSKRCTPPKSKKQQAVLDNITSGELSSIGARVQTGSSPSTETMEA